MQIIFNIFILYFLQFCFALFEFSKPIPLFSVFFFVSAFKKSSDKDYAESHFYAIINAYIIRKFICVKYVLKNKVFIVINKDFIIK